MPIKLGRAFPPDWLGYPPHMSARDFVLWKRFTTNNPRLATRYYYDVTLGSGAFAPEDTDPTIDQMWNRLTSFRADVIADTGDHWTLIELRDNASTGALGALIVYGALWALDPPDARPLTLWLITNRIHPDLRPILTTHHIHLELV